MITLECRFLFFRVQSRDSGWKLIYVNGIGVLVCLDVCLQLFILMLSVQIFYKRQNRRRIVFNMLLLLHRKCEERLLRDLSSCFLFAMVH
jgi:hypothetical protein